MVSPSNLHSPLRSKEAFRLFTLQPSGLDDQLCGDLWESEPLTAPAYECLSYTWGDVSRREEMIVNGTKISIGRNLWEFLVRVRLPDRPRVLWMDAVCISQTDLKEKAQQVEMIGDIFENARRVLIWLGEHADGSEYIFRGFPRGRASLAVFFRTLFHMYPPWENFSARVTAWSAFLSRPYWSRTWVLQEIAIAQELVVHCGPDMGSWEEVLENRMYPRFRSSSFDGADHVVAKFSRPVRSKYRKPFLKAIAHLDVIIMMRKDFLSKRMKTPSGFGSTFLPVPPSTCLDRRDKVYALRSLMRNRSPRGVVPVDYTISVVELAARALRVDEVFGWDNLISHLDLSATELRDVVDRIFEDNFCETYHGDAWLLDHILTKQLDIPYTTFQEDRGSLDALRRRDHLLQWRREVDASLWQQVKMREPNRDDESFTRRAAVRVRKIITSRRQGLDGRK